ncbi:MAG: hypothetical protein KAR17_20220 [Cyclobacteriaceae bacterium]|nr:hypothetical protein [Cyclobacteriaceae bacterium]
MIYRLFITCLLTQLSININYAQSYIHDFDSLVKHSKEFESRAKIIGDTADIFNDNSILDITLESDFKNLIKRKFKDEYQEAVCKIMFNDSIRVTRNIKIKPRGHMRKSSCNIPPLKLNFPKKNAYIEQLHDFDKIKMVLDCKRGSLYEQYILLEYYAYKLQNIITDYSLRVRLIRVKYVDTSGKFKEDTRLAFLIENINQLASRLNAMRIETKNIRDRLTDKKTLVDAYFFQYLIGNTDWSIPGMHNVYLLKSLDPTLPLPYVIPYDFDYAGIVNTMYAIPDERLGTESVRERVYRGVCLPEADLFNSAERILQKKNEIYALFENDILLNKANKRSSLKYIDEFFTIFENKNSFKRNIIDACR